MTSQLLLLQNCHMSQSQSYVVTIEYGKRFWNDNVIIICLIYVDLKAYTEFSIEFSYINLIQDSSYWLILRSLSCNTYILENCQVWFTPG